MAKRRILIVDDEEGMLEVCADTLEVLPDIEIITEQYSPKAEKLLLEEPWDLLITDIKMPEKDGIELLEVARSQDKDMPVLMLTAYPSVETAVKSMKLGATDYITKPFLPDDLQHKVERILTEKDIREENRFLRKQVKQKHRMGAMIGKSAPMQKIYDLIERIAQTNYDVLIEGETGTGKELAARNIHEKSQRGDQNFVPVNCGAIPGELLESEFFGHEKGAFTGAEKKSIGLIEFADKGTLFLDEIGELPMNLQAKLLRVLQERKIRRVGGTSEFKVDIRIIAATAADLTHLIEQNRFRRDLYYRINVAEITVPPLRERKDDIPLLISHFLKQQKEVQNLELPVIDSDVMEVLKYYHWPGNVRELQNVIKKLLIMSTNNRIEIHDLPDEITASAVYYDKEHTNEFFDQREKKIQKFEQQYFTDLLKKTKGNVAKAAEKANIPRGSLYRLLNKNNLNPEDFRS